eukprot:jgi/Ulvmu1/9021/UM005_0112.1
MRCRDKPHADGDQALSDVPANSFSSSVMNSTRGTLQNERTPVHALILPPLLILALHLPPFPKTITMAFAQASRAQCTVRPACTASRRVIARAEEADKISFKPNNNAALGFTEDDSAGQSNIFAVEPKTYVQSQKPDSNSNATLLIGGIAAAFAVALLVVGLGANSGNVSVADTVYADAGKYQGLAYYATSLK